MEQKEIENSPIKCMFWKDEILQLLYWMEGENLGTIVSSQQILTFINTNALNLDFHLAKLQKEGYLENSIENGISKYALSESGKKEGAKYFAEAFKGMQKAGHGECGPDCEFCYGPDGVKLDNCVHNCAS